MLKSMLLMFGPIFVVVTLYRWHKHKRCNVRVKATVVGFDSYMSRGHRGGSIEVYSPIMTYEWNGWTRTLQDRAYSSWNNFEVGDVIDIYINPDNPSEFMYDKFPLRNAHKRRRLR